MSVLIGYDTWAYDVFEDDSTSLRDIKYLESNGSIIDEISLRSKTDQGTSNVRDNWNNDTSILAEFGNTLEAGNINNEGVKIVKFKVVRRKPEQTEDIYLGEIEYDGIRNEMEFIDGTQPNDELIYTIIPVGENGLDGSPREINLISNFTGYWLVDKNTNEVLSFDQAIGSIGTIENAFNQNRTMIETFAPHPQFYYGGNQEYHSFTLSATFIPEEWERSGDIYMNILNNFAKQHKPFLVKSDNGLIYVANISNLRTSTPQNTWKGHDYITVSIDITESNSIEDYMKEE